MRSGSWGSYAKLRTSPPSGPTGLHCCASSPTATRRRRTMICARVFISKLSARRDGRYESAMLFSRQQVTEGQKVNSPEVPPKEQSARDERTSLHSLARVPWVLLRRLNRGSPSVQPPVRLLLFGRGRLFGGRGLFGCRCGLFGGAGSLLFYRGRRLWLFTSADQSESVRRIERILPHRLLKRTTGAVECDIHTAIGCQLDHLHVLRNSSALTGSQIGSRIDRLLHFLVAEFSLLAVGLGLDIGFRYSVADQHFLGTGCATLGQSQVVFVRTTRIGVGFKNESSVRILCQINLEVRGHTFQRLRLAG